MTLQGEKRQNTQAAMNPPLPRQVMEELRQIWVQADGDTIGADLGRARALAASLPDAARTEGEDFVHALEKLGQWLRQG